MAYHIVDGHSPKPFEHSDAQTRAHASTHARTRTHTFARAHACTHEYVNTWVVAQVESSALPGDSDNADEKK